jgi:hypothetical protein
MTREKRLKLWLISFSAVFAGISFYVGSGPAAPVAAQKETPSGTPVVIPFDQTDALNKLSEQIKGKENEPAEKVFKNIQSLKGVPAGRLLRIMEIGYGRSLGVSCSHCHVPGQWESESKPTKQIARDMVAMVGTINGQMLKNIKNLNERATINCTTCHRGQIAPALNIGNVK